MVAIGGGAGSSQPVNQRPIGRNNSSMGGSKTAHSSGASQSKFVGGPKSQVGENNFTSTNHMQLDASIGAKSNASLIGKQVEAEAASVDDKIQKLQNLLKMAKG